MGIFNIALAFIIITGFESNEIWRGNKTSKDDDSSLPPSEPILETTSELEELYLAIKASNRSLMKLSIVTRNSPIKDDYLKAVSHYLIDSTRILATFKRSMALLVKVVLRFYNVLEKL